MSMEEQLGADIQQAEIGLETNTQQAEQAVAEAVLATQSAVTSAQRLERLQAALDALQGISQPAPAVPVQSITQDVSPEAIFADTSLADTLAARTTDFGEAPPPAQANSAGQIIVPGQHPPQSVTGVPGQAPPQAIVVPGQPVRKRRDDPQALAASLNKGLKCNSCGAHGTQIQFERYIGDTGPFTFRGCSSCNTERMIG